MREEKPDIPSLACDRFSLMDGRYDVKCDPAPVAGVGCFCYKGPS